MIERLLLTILVTLIGMAIFSTFRISHMRRANKSFVAAPAQVEKPKLLYFRSDSCAPCVSQSHYLQVLESEYGNRVTIQKIDADVDVDLTTRYGIFTLPTTLIVDRRGEVRHINYGLTATTKLAQQLEKIK